MLGVLGVLAGPGAASVDCDSLRGNTTRVIAKGLIVLFLTLTRRFCRNGLNGKLLKLLRLLKVDS